MKTKFPNVTIAADRHGKLRARWRKAGRKPVYMQTLPGQPGFKEELARIVADQPAVAAERWAPGSVNDLIARYYRSGDFAGRGIDLTQRRRRGLIEAFREEFGNDQVAHFGFDHIEAILLNKARKRIDDKSGRTIGGQVAAHSLRKELRRLFALAVKLRLIGSNPVEQAASVGSARITGFHTWTEAEIAAYQRRHPVGTSARLALEIILWTGQRRGDARLFGPAHIVRGKINYRASKTGADLWLPIAPELRAAIDAMPRVGIKTYLVTEAGHPFSAPGFGNKFRDWCNAAGLTQCSAHGLRKAIARRMAESEATQRGIKAVGGWRGDSEVTIYTEAAEQERLAEDALGRVIHRFGSTDLSNPPFLG